MPTERLHNILAVQLAKQNRLQKEFAWLTKQSIEDFLDF